MFTIVLLHQFLLHHHSYPRLCTAEARVTLFGLLYSSPFVVPFWIDKLFLIFAIKAVPGFRFRKLTQEPSSSVGALLLKLLGEDPFFYIHGVSYFRLRFLMWACSPCTPTRQPAKSSRSTKSCCGLTMIT